MLFLEYPGDGRSDRRRRLDRRNQLAAHERQTAGYNRRNYAYDIVDALMKALRNGREATAQRLLAAGVKSAAEFWEFMVAKARFPISPATWGKRRGCWSFHHIVPARLYNPDDPATHFIAHHSNLLPMPASAHTSPEPAPNPDQ